MKLGVAGLALLLFTNAWAGPPRLPEPALGGTLQAKADDAKAHFDRGIALVGKADFDGAIAESSHAIRVGLYGKGNLDGAIAEFREASELDPGNKQFRASYERLSKELKK